MEFDIEKCAGSKMKSRKIRITEGIELPNLERIRTLGEKKIINTLEYRKQIPSNKWR